MIEWCANQRFQHFRVQGRVQGGSATTRAFLTDPGEEGGGLRWSKEMLAGPSRAGLPSFEFALTHGGQWGRGGVPGFGSQLAARLDWKGATGSALGMATVPFFPLWGFKAARCRQPLVDEIEAEWGDAFNMTSLGGMLTLPTPSQPQRAVFEGC